MTKEVLFAGLLGFGLGGGVIGFSIYGIMKRKYTDILKKTVDNYEKLLDENEVFDGEDDIPDEFRRVIKNDGDKTEEVPERYSEKDRQMIKEKLRYNNKKTTEYAKMYGSPKDTLESDETTEDDSESETDESDEVNTNIFEASKLSNRKPVIISEEHYNEYLDNSSVWDCSELFLYSDGTITTEDDKIIDGEELTIMLGDCLDKYNFLESDEKNLYVQCFRLSTIYSIQKFDKPFIPSV